MCFFRSVNMDIYLNILDYLFQSVHFIDNWTPNINLNNRKYISNCINKGMKDSNIKFNNLSNKNKKYVMYQLIYYIFKKTIFFGNIDFNLIEISIDIDIDYKKCFPQIDPIVINNFVNSMIKIKNKSNNIHELNHKFNMMLNAIIDSIDFTTILCEINHFYTAKGNKIKHLRKIIIGEELAL